MEYLDICDENGIPTGKLITRDVAHKEGVLHRTAHVWIVRKTAGRYEVLLQKRSREKDSFPGFYDTSSAGHIPAGSEPLPSAVRELREELGISTSEKDLTFIGVFHSQYEKEFHHSVFRDNEITRLYLYKTPVEISELSLQESEVEEVRWFDLVEVYEEIQRDRSRICVPYGSLKLLRDYLKNHYSETELYTNRNYKAPEYM